MLFRCNILALIGGGVEPQYPPNKVMIWDDHQRVGGGAVRLRHYRIVVVLDQRVFVYNFADLKLMQQIETVSNRKGLWAVSQAAATFVLVCPGTQKGQVRVENYSSKRTKFIAAHDSRVACFALTSDGRLLTVLIFFSFLGEGSKRKELFRLENEASWMVADVGQFTSSSLHLVRLLRHWALHLALFSNTQIVNYGIQAIHQEFLKQFS